MTDIGVVGFASVTIDPDWAGFAESVRTQLIPQLQQVRSVVQGIDASVLQVTKSLQTSVEPARALSSALNSIDVGEFVAVGEASGVVAGSLEAATVAAEGLNATLDLVDPKDLVEAAVASEALNLSLAATTITAQTANVALDAIDAKDLVAVSVAANTASVSLEGTAVAARIAGNSISSIDSGGIGAGAGGFSGLSRNASAAALGIGAVGVAVAGTAAISAKAAVDFDTAWIGVTKTVDGTAAEMAALQQGIIDLSKEIPVSTTELAALAENAGALGIQTPNILEFTKVMADLGQTTNLTSEQASTSFAKIANVVGISQDQFDEMGATLVALGNNGESTEAEILELTNRIAASGKQVDLTGDQILGLASSMASLGIPAEAGGTAIQKTFFDIDKAVRDGGASLKGFADVAGVSSEEFARVFNEDAVQALDMFTAGLGTLEDSGGSAAGALEGLGIAESRQILTLLKLSEANGIIDRDQAQAAKAWTENTALVGEAEKRYGSFASQFEIMKNQFMDTARVIGEGFLPQLIDLSKQVATSLTPVFEILGEVSRDVIVVFSSVMKSVTPLIKTLGDSFLVAFKNIRPIIDDVAHALEAAFGDPKVKQAVEDVARALGPAVANMAKFLPLLVNPNMVQVMTESLNTLSFSFQAISAALEPIIMVLQATGVIAPSVISNIYHAANATDTAAEANVSWLESLNPLIAGFKEEALAAREVEIAAGEMAAAVAVGTAGFEFLALGIGNLRFATDDNIVAIGENLGLNGDAFKEWSQEVIGFIDEVVASAAAQLPKVSDAFTFNNGQQLFDPATIEYQLQQQANSVQHFQENLEQLSDRGLNNLVAQLLQQGPIVGGALAASLLAGAPERAAALDQQLAMTQLAFNSLTDWVQNVFGPRFAVTSGMAAKTATDLFGTEIEASIPGIQSLGLQLGDALITGIESANMGGPLQAFGASLANDLQVGFQSNIGGGLSGIGDMASQLLGKSSTKSIGSGGAPGGTVIQIGPIMVDGTGLTQDDAQAIGKSIGASAAEELSKREMEIRAAIYVS